MAIKQAEPLSRADFDEAMVRLRLSVSEVAKETGIPRTYLSEYRNGDRKLRPENLAKLRDYFEAKGIEFDDPETSHCVFTHHCQHLLRRHCHSLKPCRTRWT